MAINNNKLLVSLLGLLSVLTYALNCTKKMSECSLVFVLLAVTVSIIAELYSTKKAIAGLLLSVILNYLFLQDTINYFIDGYVIPNIIVASLLSVVISLLCSTYILAFLKKNYPVNFNSRLLISLLVCSVIDYITMSAFYIKHFSIDKVLNKFSLELIFKFSYSLSIFAFLLLVSFVTFPPKSSYK